MVTGKVYDNRFNYYHLSENLLKILTQLFSLQNGASEDASQALSVPVY